MIARYATPASEASAARRAARKARIGVIGADWWTTDNHLPILARRGEVELAGVCRLGREELAQVRTAAAPTMAQGRP